MPAKNTTRLTDVQKQTIAVLRTQGLSNSAIAAKMGLHPITVSKSYSEFRRDAAGVIDDLGNDWRRDMKILAVRAVKRALADESDKYKSGNIGVQALRGIGEFERDGNTVNVAAIISSIPPDMRDRYLSSEDLEPRVVSVEDGAKNTDETLGEK
jgi:hypothetical protein